MRLSLLPLLLASLALGACTIRSSTVSDDPYSPPPDDTYTVPSDPPAPQHAPAAPTTTKPADGVLPEVTYLFMRDKFRQGWMCTATLIAPDKAITAAHCLDTTEMVSWQIVAPNAPGSPTVDAKNPQVFGGAYADVANPDLGVLTLVTPIVLPAYAELTDVTARVAAGEDVRAAAVVRTSEEPEAPFHVISGLAVSSTVPYGYDHGFGTPMFSEGGDSGAGLFLFENGAITHKLIGVARQPEPSRDLDHFTRIDSDMLAWYAR